jgi:hypothetical protein
MYVLAGGYFYHEPMDVFPIIASSIAGAATFLFTGLQMRIAFLLVSAFWLCFNLYAHSIGGVMADVSVLIINGITILRILNDKKYIQNK